MEDARRAMVGLSSMFGSIVDRMMEQLGMTIVDVQLKLSAGRWISALQLFLTSPTHTLCLPRYCDIFETSIIGRLLIISRKSGEFGSIPKNDCLRLTIDVAL